MRCRPGQAEVVLAELTVLAPNGVEEESGPDYVEYALYGGEGELPELGEIEAAAGDGLVEVVATRVPDDWADRWRDFHRPILVGDRLCVRPSWEDGDGRATGGTIDIVVDPGRAFGTGAHPTTRLCLELLLELEEAGDAGGPLSDLGTGSGVLAIAAAKLGWSPVSAYDHEQAAIDAAAENARLNDVELTAQLANLRDGLPDLAPTTVANMTAPVLSSIAHQMVGDRGRGHRSNSGEAPQTPPPTPDTLLCSGLLPEEADDVAAKFSVRGLKEVERRIDGDWAALLLRRR